MASQGTWAIGWSVEVLCGVFISCIFVSKQWKAETKTIVVILVEPAQTRLCKHDSTSYFQCTHHSKTSLIELHKMTWLCLPALKQYRHDTAVFLWLHFCTRQFDFCRWSHACKRSTTCEPIFKLLCFSRTLVPSSIQIIFFEIQLHTDLCLQVKTSISRDTKWYTFSKVLYL